MFFLNIKKIQSNSDTIKQKRVNELASEYRNTKTPTIYILCTCMFMCVHACLAYLSLRYRTNELKTEFQLPIMSQ